MSTPQIVVGQVQIQALLDAHLTFVPSRMFAEVPAERWRAYRELYPHAFNADGLIMSNAICYLLRSRGHLVLLDLGVDAGPVQERGGIRGQLLEQLASAGVAPEAIDTVVITHLHWDHVGWAVQGDAERRAPTFPHARVLVSQADWAFFRDSANPLGGIVQATVAPLHAQGMVELVNGEHAVTDELTMMPTPGHTPGHCSLLVQSQGEGCVLTGDVFHSLAQVSETGWSRSADDSPSQAAATRRSLVQQAELQGLTLAAGHFPFPGFGRIVRIDGERRFQALTLPE